MEKHNLTSILNLCKKRWLLKLLKWAFKLIRLNSHLPSSKLLMELSKNTNKRSINYMKRKARRQNSIQKMICLSDNNKLCMKIMKKIRSIAMIRREIVNLWKARPNLMFNSTTFPRKSRRLHSSTFQSIREDLRYQWKSTKLLFPLPNWAWPRTLEVLKRRSLTTIEWRKFAWEHHKNSGLE